MPPDASPHDLATHNHGIAEAARWLSAALGTRPLPPLIAAIGLRAGHLLDVLEQVAPDTRVLALEPDPAAAMQFQARRDWSRWRSSNQLVYLTGPAYAGADEAWRMFSAETDDHLLLVHPDVTRSGGEAAVAAARTFKKILFGARANATARRKFAPRYLLNSLANLPAIVRGADVSALTDAYLGTPAVIVGAGPSLDAVRHELGGCADRAMIIATDTALRPMLSAGIRPPVVVGVDPGEKNARHFHGLGDLSETWLVAESALDPGAVSLFGDRTFWFRLSDHEPWPWYQTLGVETGHLKIWGSVLTAAFQVAVLAGCDPIVFVGADLAFTGGRPYARGTTYELDWGYSTAIGDTLDRAWGTQMAMCDPAIGFDARNDSVVTTEPLLAFRDWMVTHAARSGRRVVNATGAGILIGGGIEQRPLGEVLDRVCRVPSPGAYARARSIQTTTQQLAARCRAAGLALERGDLATPPLPQWTEFAGGSLDAKAVGMMLGAAADDLDSQATGRARTVASGSVTCVQEALEHMPEALTRLRAWLNGTDCSHEGTAHPVRALARAHCLLGPAADAILGSTKRPDEPLRPEGIGLSPVSGSRAWSSDIAWLVQTTEALIGEACDAAGRDRPARTTESFFTRAVALPEEHEGDDLQAAPEGDDTGNRRLVGQLFDEWTRCALERSDKSGLATHALPSMDDRLRALTGAVTSALVAGSPLDASSADSALVLEARDDGQSTRLEVPIGPSASLARAATGAIRSDGPKLAASPTGPMPFTPGSGSGFAAALRFRGAVHRLFASAWDGGDDAGLLTPRVLTDEGMPRAMPGYSRDGGVICAPLHGVESFLVGEDGRITPHATWPRPMCAILPLGESGDVAWSNGTHNWPEVESGYVMYRKSAHDSIAVQELSFGPTTGVWWNDRLYWTTYPNGFASWALGEPGAMIDHHLTLVGILAEESMLELGACERHSNGSLVRRRMSRGWGWAPTSGLSPLICGVDGASTCRSTDTGWEAEAFPESDLIRLRRPDGRSASLTCYYPYLVAWAGESLVVGTIHGELLLFEHVRSHVDRITGG